MNEIIASLLAAIETDRDMFINAKIDPMFDNVRPQVDALLEDILQKTKVNAEKQVSNAEFAVRRMKSWFDGDRASSDDVQKYNSILNKISDAKDKIKMHTYVGYDDALRIMSGTSEMITDIQASIRNDLASLKIEFKRDTNNIDDVSNKIKYLKRNKKRGTIILIILFELFLLFSISPPGIILLIQGLILLFLFVVCYKYIRNLYIVDVLIIAYIISILLLLITFLTRLDFVTSIACIIWIAVPFILPHIFKSEDVSGLKREKTELKKQTGVLKHRISAAEDSLL